MRTIQVPITRSTRLSGLRNERPHREGSSDVTTLQNQQAETSSRSERSGRRLTAPFRPHVVGAVFGRNFLGYFSNPTGYVFIFLFVLVCSWAEFWQPIFFANNLANLDPLNAWMPYLLLFFIPAVTMSIWAEERRQGTDELLLTLPANDVEVVLGKYLAALGIYTVSLIFLAVGHVPLLKSLGNPDLGVIAATYLGYWLMGVMLIAVGMVASLLSSNVTVAFILGAVFCAVPVFASGLGPVGEMISSLQGLKWLSGIGKAFGGLSSALAGTNTQRVIEDLSIPSQFHDFGTGVVPLSGVVYFLAMAAGMLYLNRVLLGRRHWAGGQASAGRWIHAVVRVASVVLALISADVLVSRWINVRVDATEERLHTLSKPSRDLVQSLPTDRPVYIQAYYSPEVPREYVQVKADLLNTLREFAAMGGDKIRLNLVETRRYSDEAREAEKRFGITAKRVPTINEGRQSTEELYLGVAFTSGLEQVVVPFFDRGLPVEYELTRSIRVVSGSERKRVGILETDAKLLGGLDFQSMSQETEWEIVQELKKQYEVGPVSADVPIPIEEVQTISISGIPNGGTFTLTFDGQTTPPIPYNADAPAVAKALAELSNLDPSDLSASGGPLPKTAVEVTFKGRFTGQHVPELTAQSALTGENSARPTVRAQKSTTIFDAVLVAQAPSLTQKQIENLTEYIRKGGATLLLLDPMPLVNLSLAPEERRTPMGGMFNAPPPEPKGNLLPLLDLLGIEWPRTEIVWNPYNPHPQLELPVEYIFIGRGSGASEPFGNDPISSGLQEIFLPFPGLLRSRAMPGDPTFTPLLRTNDLGGTLSYDEALQRGPFGLSRLRPERPHFPSNRPYTLAAKIEGTVQDPAHAEGKDAKQTAAKSKIRVIAVADLDMISDSFFELRRKPTSTFDFLDFDNVTFVLNCVDTLAGDETFIELRKKRPKHRTLTALEAESKRYIDKSQAEEQKAEDNARSQLEAAQKRLDDAVDKIRNSKEYDERTKESMVRYRQQVEQRRLDLIKSEIEAEKKQAIEESKARREQAIEAIQNRVRAQAIALTPLPALILGVFVFFIRASRENRGANPSRLA